MKFRRKIILLLITTIAVVGGYFWYENMRYDALITKPEDPNSTDRIMFEIEKGESVKSVAARLEEKKLINSAWALYRYVKYNQLGDDIQAGRIILQKSYTIPEVVQYLTRGLGSELPVIIREGLTIKQIDEYLAKEGIMPAGEFETCAKTCEFDYAFLSSKPKNQSLEGYLFPDTYFLDPDNVTAKALIIRMLQNFENRTSGLFGSNKHSIHEIITMASMIEKEERDNDEKPTVAGILWKRLANGMLLGVDATTRYVFDKWNEPLTQKDLDNSSPYNTRKSAGLPPGPIGSPSLSSIKAALNPKESDFWYYLHDNMGQIRYAKTLEEHNANKRNYL